MSLSVAEIAGGGISPLQLNALGELRTASQNSRPRKIIRGQQIRMMTPDENGNLTAYRYVNRGSTLTYTEFINVRGYEKITVFIQPGINGNAGTIAPTFFIYKWDAVSAETASGVEAGTYAWSTATGVAPLPTVWNSSFNEKVVTDTNYSLWKNADLEFLSVAFKSHTSNATDALTWTIEVHLS